MKRKYKNSITTIVPNAALILEETDLVNEVLVEETEDTQIVAYDPVVFIPSLQVAAARATFLEKDEETGEMYADWDGTALFRMHGTKLEYLMMEQDGLLITLYNQYRKDMDTMMRTKAIMADCLENCVETNYVETEVVKKLSA